jgi:hypothetical protein
VETEDSYNFSLYGEPRPGDVDGKADVDSRRLITGEVLLDAAVLGEDPADIVDATFTGGMRAYRASSGEV